MFSETHTGLWPRKVSRFSGRKLSGHFREILATILVLSCSSVDPCFLYFTWVTAKFEVPQVCEYIPENKTCLDRLARYLTGGDTYANRDFENESVKENFEYRVAAINILMHA